MSIASQITFAGTVCLIVTVLATPRLQAQGTESEEVDLEQVAKTRETVKAAANYIDGAAEALQSAIHNLDGALGLVEKAKTIVGQHEDEQNEALETLAAAAKANTAQDATVAALLQVVEEKQATHQAAELLLSHSLQDLASAVRELQIVSTGDEVKAAKNALGRLKNAFADETTETEAGVTDDLADNDPALRRPPLTSPGQEILPEPEPAKLDTREASLRLPLVKEMPVADKTSDFLDWDAYDFGIGTFAVNKYFEKPAHFPLPGHGFLGQRQDSEGALIYEGMRFVMDANGHYRIHFVVGTPAMPVTLRLQFVLADEFGMNQRTVTLPPISIPRKRQPKHNAEPARVAPVYANTQTVYHEGYLNPSVERNGVPVRLSKVVSRKGTARFGFGVDVP